MGNIVIYDQNDQISECEIGGTCSTRVRV